MTGEKPDTEAPQPGGREPAPGALALVQAFMNTHFDLTAEDHGERLVSVTALTDWLTTHALLRGQLNLHPADLQRTITVREGLRALALANNHQNLIHHAIGAMRQASTGTRSEIHIEPDGPRLVIAVNAGRWPDRYRCAMSRNPGTFKGDPQTDERPGREAGAYAGS